VRTMPDMTKTVIAFLVLWSSLAGSTFAQENAGAPGGTPTDVAGFYDSSHHWYDIEDEDKVITPLPDQHRYDSGEVSEIADNILLFQKSNGGWPKNYDMLAVLTKEQRAAVLAARNQTNTTFDNGATYSQVEFLARAYSVVGDDAYREACIRGLDFILSAQYPNGGWPQFYPDTTGYRKFITFNDGAMIGVMTVLHHILRISPDYRFVDGERRAKVDAAYERGIRCILNCRVTQHGERIAWGQQHDNVDFRLREARTFEPASLAARESAGIVLFLMDIDHPNPGIVEAVQRAVAWLEKSEISGIRVKEIKAPVANYTYRKNVDFDRIVVDDSAAPPIWARMYEIGTNVPLFCNRDRKCVYTLAEVDRERRAGYTWYCYEPAEVLERYPDWRTKWVKDEHQH
jgi:PelA/Pel-15E family pectate lyase